MWRHHFGLVTLAVAILIGYGDSILLPQKMRIGNCKGCVRECDAPQGPQATTEEPPPQRSVKREIAEALTAYTREVSTIIVIVETRLSQPSGSTRHKRSLKALLLRPKRQDNTPPEEMFRSFRVQMIEWNSDINGLGEDDLREIRTATEGLVSLRNQLASDVSMTFTSEVISIAKSTVRVTTTLISDVYISIESDIRVEAFEGTQTTFSGFQTTIGDIYESFSSLETSVITGSSSSISITVVTEIIEVVEIIEEYGSIVMTQDKLDLLMGYQNQLDSIVSSAQGTIVVTQDDMALIQLGAGVTQRVQARITEELSVTQIRGSLQNTMALYSEALSATSIVQSSINEIRATQEVAEVMNDDITYSISGEYSEVYRSLEGSLELVSRESISTLKSFRLTADEIIQYFQTHNVQIVGLQEIRRQNEELQIQLFDVTEELSARSSVLRRAEVVEKAKYLLIRVKETAERIQGSTTDSVNLQVDIDKLSSFLLSINITEITETIVQLLETRLEELTRTISSNSSGSTTVNVDNLLTVATSSLTLLREETIRISRAEEQVLSQERVEIVESYVNDIIVESTSLMERFSASAVSSDTANIESAISNMMSSFSRFSSQSYVITDEDIVSFTAQYEAFMTSSEEIQAFSSIEGLEEISTMAASASSVLESRVETIGDRVVNKKSLNKLEYMSLVLSSVGAYVLTLNESLSPSFSPASLIIVEITSKIVVWSQSTQYIQMTDIESVAGLFFTLQTLIQPNEEVSGISGLQLAITAAEATIASSEEEVLIMDERSEAVFNERTSLSFMSTNLDSMQELLSLTESNEGEMSETESQLIINVTIIIEGLVRRTTDISEEEVHLLMEASRQVAELIDRVRNGTLGGTIPGLAESVARVEGARNSLRERITEEETNTVDVLSSVVQTINITRSLLMTAFVNESTVDSSYVTARSQDIDDFSEIVVRVRDQPNSITEQDLQTLRMKYTAIRRFLSSVTEFTIVRGYRVTIMFIIQIIDAAQASLAARIVEEGLLNEEEAGFSASRQLLSNINEIVFILIRLLDVETVSSTFQSGTYISLLEDLAGNTSLFVDQESVTTLMTELWDLEKREEKPNDVESLRDRAISARQRMTYYVEDLQTTRHISRSIRHATFVSDITTNLGHEIGNTIETTEPGRFLGNDSEEINEVIVTIRSMILNFDSTRTEEITNMVSRVSVFVSSVNETQEGIGNILSLRRLVRGLQRRANTRRREQRDRTVVKQQIVEVERLITLLNETRQTVSTTIERIGNISSTGTEMTVITNLTTLLRMSVEELISSGSEDSIRQYLIAISSANVEEGVEIPGIFALQSTIDQQIRSVQVQREFLVSTQNGRKRVDIYLMIFQTVTDIRRQLEIIMNSNRGNNIGSAPLVFDDVSKFLNVLILNEEVSYSIKRNLETALTDLRNLNLRRSIPMNKISEVFEKSRIATQSMTRSLEIERHISNERLQVRLYERSTEIFTQAQESFDSVGDLQPNGNGGWDNEISRITEQLQKASESSTVEEEHIDRVQELLRVINTTNASTLTQIDVSNIQNATNYAKRIWQTVQESISTSQKAIVLSATRTKRVRVLSVFKTISDHIERISSTTGIISSYGPEPETVLELRRTIETFDADTASPEEISEFTKMVEVFLNMSGTNGTLIRGLRQLNTKVISRTVSYRQSLDVFSTINEATTRSVSINRASTVFSQMNREIEDTLNSYGDDDDDEGNGNDDDDAASEAMMLVLSEASEGFSSDSIERSTEIAEDALEKFMRLRKAGIRFRKSVIIIIRRVVRRIIISIRREVTGSISRTTRLRQSIALQEMTRTVRLITEITGQLKEFDIDDTQSDNETEADINRILILFRRYESNAIDIREEDLSFIRERISVLKSFVRRRVNLRIILTLNRQSTSVATSLSREAETLTRESQREQNALLRARLVTVLLRAWTVFREIYSSATHEDSSSEEIRVHEVDRISEIMTRIERETATEREIALMEEYTEILSSSWRTQASRGRITGVRQSLARISSMRRNMEMRLTDDSFASSYSEEVYEQKQFKSLLLQAQTTFEGLIATEGDGTGDSFTSPLFEEITRIADRISSEYSSTQVDILRRKVAELKETTSTISKNTRITGLTVAYRRIQSTTLSVETRVSRSYLIERVSQETENLREETNLLSRLQRTVINIGDKQGNQEFMELNETIHFLRKREAYNSMEIIQLREHVSQLEEFDQNFNVGLNRIESLRYSLVNRITRITTLQRITLRTQRTESQNIYINAATRMVKNAYRRVAAVTRISGEEGIMVVNEGVTRYSMFLQSIDMGAISTEQIKMINTRTQEFFGAIESINISVHSIAQFSSVLEHLRQFSYASEQHVRTQEILEHEQRTSVILRESSSAIRSKLESLHSLRGTSDQEITAYVERDVITRLFNFLEPFTFNFRLITSDFRAKLDEFDFSNIETDSIPDGTGIRYLEEIRILLQQFLDAQELETNIKESDTTVIERDVQISLSRFTNIVEQFLFTDRDENESQDTDEGSSGTEDNGESDIFLADDELVNSRNMFREIISNIEELSYETNNFNSKTLSLTTELIYRFMEANVRVVFTSFSKSYLTKQLSTFRSMSTKITSSINTRQSRVKVQRSYRLIHEVTQLLYTIKMLFEKISQSQTGSSHTNEILSSIRLLLQRMTYINFFISQEDVNTLRQLTFRLRIAATINETITLEDSEFSDFLTSRIYVAETASSSQASFVTTSKDISSTSQVSIDQESGFISYASTSRAFAMQVTYSKEESVALVEINRVSIISYVIKEYQSLLALAITSLSELLEYVNSGSSTSATDEEDEEIDEDEEENEESLALSQVSLALSSFDSNIENLQVSSVSEFAVLIQKIQSFINSSIEIKPALINESLTLILSVNETINEYIASSYNYSSEAQKVLNIQESSSSLVELSNFADRFEASNDSASEDTLSEEAQQHIDFITTFVMEFSLRGFVSRENSLLSFKRSLRYLKKNMKSIRISSSTLITWRNFMRQGRASRTESSIQVASEGAILRSQTQRDYQVYSRGRDIINNYSTLIGRFTSSLDGSGNSQSLLLSSCRQIIMKIIIIIRLWPFRIDIIIIIMRYYKELSEMLPLLEGAQLPEEFQILEREVTRTQTVFITELERIDAEASENNAFAVMDAKYQLYSQMDSYFINTYGIQISEGQTENTTSQSEIEIEEVSVLYDLLSTAFSQQAEIDIEDIYENFRNLVSSLQNVSSVTHVAGYTRLVQLIQDRAEYQQASRRAKVFGRVAVIVSEMSGSIPLSLASEWQTYTNLVYNGEIRRFYKTLQVFQTNLYSVRLSSIYSLSRQVYNFRRILETSSLNIPYLVEVDQSLSNIQSSSGRYARLVLELYDNRRASRILSSSSNALSQAVENIGNYISNNRDEYETSLEVNTLSRETFDYFINNTLSYSSLPFDFGSEILNFNFTSFSALSVYNRSILKKIMRILVRLKEKRNHVQSRLYFMQRTNLINRVTQTVRDAIENLRRVLADNSDAMNANNDADVDETSSDDGNSSTENTTSQSGDGAQNEEDCCLTINEVLVRFANLTETFIRYDWEDEESNLEDFEQYGRILVSISPNLKARIFNLSEIINQLSNNIILIYQFAQSSESAYHASIHSSLLQDTFEMSNMIRYFLQSFSQTQVTPQFNSLLMSIQEHYENFNKGLGYINQDDIISCWELVLELTSLNVSEGDMLFNASGLLSSISDIDNNLSDMRGFLSVISYYYETYIKWNTIYSQTNIMSRILKMGYSSQQSYGAFEIRRILIKMKDVIPRITAVDNTTNTSQPQIFGDIAATLKSAASRPEFIQVGIIFTLYHQLFLLETTNESSIVLREELIQGFLDFIENKIIRFENIATLINPYGWTSTKVFILEQATKETNRATDALREWISRGIGSTESTSTVSSVTTVSPVSVGYNGTSSGSLDAQEWFEEISEILVHWAFDSSSISFRSLTDVMEFLNYLETSCETVKGLHIWEYLLISANKTLSELLEDVYIDQILGSAYVEEDVFRYNYGIRALDSTLDVIGTESDNGTDSNETSDESEEGTPSGGDNSTESEGRHTEIQNSIAALISSSHTLVENWRTSLRAGVLGVKGLISSSSELSDLVKAGGDLNKSTINDLRVILLEQQNFTEFGIAALSLYSEQTAEEKSYTFGKSFLAQAKNLAEYSLSLIEKIRNETDGESTEYTITIEEDEDCLLLDCSAGHFLSAVQRLESPGLENNSTMASGNTSEAINETSVNFMDGYDNEVTVYDEARSGVYGFARALQRVGRQDYGTFDNVTRKLDLIVDILEDRLQSMANETMEMTADVSAYIDTEGI